MAATMNIEQKARTYDEALDRARNLYNREETSANIKVLCEIIFPELKESEDEKIKKAIYNALKYLETELSWDFLGDVDILDAYEWLEKQGEQKYTKKDIDDAYLQGISDTKNEMEKQYEANYQIRKDIATFIFNYKGVLKDRAKWMDHLGIKVSFGKEKPADKNEPKFHEGNWVVTNKGDIIQIETVNPDYYIVNKGIKFCKSYADTHWHLWTIEDAKDGDVLVASDKSVFIYAGSDDMYAKFYLALTKYGKLNVDGGDWEDKNRVHPATKEKCALLFQKIKNEGYKWNSEKKELKKIDDQTELTKFEDAVKDMMDDYHDAIGDYPPTVEEVKKHSAYMISLLSKNPAWNEEDENKLSDILAILRSGENCYYNSPILIDWLKSLKERIGG